MIRAKMSRIGLVALVPVVSLMLGCPAIAPPSGGGGGGGTPAAFTNASAKSGGALYDTWWEVDELAEPTSDHPLWASRPDQTSNAATGAATWRCKECHGWDYKGKDGVYASGSHATGIMGILGTTLSAQEVFDKLKDPAGHDFGSSGLTDADLWDLAKFVREGLVDDDTIIDTDGMFTGTAADGEPLFSVCAACHGTDGLSTPPGLHADHEGPFLDFPGFVSNENPWEFLHKMRFGAPGTIMPQQFGVLTMDQLNDLGTYVQTLPQAPPQ